MTNIASVVRGIILKEDKILLCKLKGADYYFFPGGRIEFGETAQQALERELKEELELSAEKFEYIGTIENFFSEKGNKYHEINLVFHVEAENATDKTPEDHLEFFWKDINKLVGENIEPTALKNTFLKWLKDKKLFWGSEKE
ncbi:MAG: hypothetical protein A2Y98_01230 [Candidatus Portnoybacteria bacterium RBG_19FT_COMBO_36_7]|uniref:Nudix hydrolase domain-containing protein n=1 Tax=Candidatus Portnoybacteria bacterium RBG_19FT_COMBO_36_7 TaxID=1801992 RepID=A0A1G2F673_9BACT|nr:MAG: hypothetical protein A2Y98_01230 [Candidatus Portnoybacteria bacterium RBG_19FT_COMBO_36_7]